MIHRINKPNGSILISILIVTLFITTTLFSMVILANSNLVLARNRVFALQAQYSAESGADVAIAFLNSGDTAYAGSSGAAVVGNEVVGGEVTILDTPTYRSTYSVSVSSGADAKERIIRATGRVFSPRSSASPIYVRNIEVMAQRSSQTVASSILSRNIIDVDSGVKNIKAKDIYVNGYINMSKNTTNLVAENITVADKNTGAANCSIGGTGNLVKPTSFTTPGQTKTKLTLAYNNCISPPGNSSNADFDVQTNVGSISKIQSTNIPWSQYMDTSYQNSVGGCSDWTTGSFPRDIPSTGNTKKTHYPDTGSGISTACGASGDLSLASGQYNINDHIHIRANLCDATACEPTFFNPDAGPAGIKFVFIEGSVNFDSVTTVAGSGPIVFVVYGSDPPSKTSVCPIGGAVYLSKNGTFSAPAAYFLATNGICLDKTRYGSDPALGGVSGKNIYVATNSGTPFDLAIDPNFPVDQVPIDLSWRAVKYRRL